MRELDRLERRLGAIEAARPLDTEARAAALEGMAELIEGRPEAADVVQVSDVFADLSEAYEATGRYEDALAAMQRAIDAGYRGEPDPRCRLAELHLRLGHPEPAHAIFDRVRVDTPDDVWLYNNAGLEYGHSGDHERALGWLDQGLELAMRTGDLERLVPQLRDLRQESLEALGRSRDDLQAQSESFVAPTQQRRHVPPVLSKAPGGSATSIVDRRAEPMMIGFAWFPREEYPKALERWPDLVDGWGVSDFGDYCREMQKRMLRYASDPDAGRISIRVAPVALSSYLPWCDERGKDPGAGPTRAAYAAERVRIGAADVVVWPPPRNGRCWCSSGRKYKQCCGLARLGLDEVCAGTER